MKILFPWHQRVKEKTCTCRQQSRGKEEVKKTWLISSLSQREKNKIEHWEDGVITRCCSCVLAGKLLAHCTAWSFADHGNMYHLLVAFWMNTTPLKALVVCVRVSFCSQNPTQAALRRIHFHSTQSCPRQVWLVVREQEKGVDPLSFFPLLLNTGNFGVEHQLQYFLAVIQLTQTCDPVGALGEAHTFTLTP